MKVSCRRCKMPRSGFHCREAAFEAAAAAELTSWGVWGRCKPRVVQGGPVAQPQENIEILEHLNT